MREWSDKDYYEAVIEIDKKADSLNKWQIGFIASLVDNPPESFSPNRRAKIKEIYDTL